MNKKIHLKNIYGKLNPRILYYMYTSGEIVGYKYIHNKYKVAIIEFYDLTRIWVLNHEIKYFLKNVQ